MTRRLLLRNELEDLAIAFEDDDKKDEGSYGEIRSCRGARLDEVEQNDEMRLAELIVGKPSSFSTVANDWVVKVSHVRGSNIESI